ncbi:MAG: adenylate/guanylate cyclase domain-containing protein [Mycobacterium sp.]
MAPTCTRCGAALRDGARFCDACGSPVASTDPLAEYKQVTVLFADVVHSMDIAAALGPERLRDIMTRLFAASARAVRRYGGTVDKFTGDGVMALFGAPVALEDHAVRGCLAALALQREVQRLAAEFEREGVEMVVRVGLNSGQVVTGEFGSSPPSYTAIGEQVGIAQRMESVAPPGGVMISESTARLVEGVVELSEPELLFIKGRREPVPARLLLQVKPHHALSGRTDSALVGRTWELAALGAIFDRVVEGNGGAIVAMCGPAGIGKSRLVREVAAIAATRGVEVFGAACESHARELPFHVVAELLRAAMKVGDGDPAAAVAQLESQLPDAGPEDLLLVGDLLGVNEPQVEVPRLDPDARRRRLTAVINAAWMNRRTPAVYVIEDVQWVDEVSESMLADFLAVARRTLSMVLITYRSDYRGVLSRLPDGQTINLAALSRSEAETLIAEQLGSDHTVAGLSETIADRAVGNPFFAKEIVRDLAERGVLHGERGRYTFDTTVNGVSVPPTLHAAIAARIDRLGRDAKRTLNAAAVAGSRFGKDLLAAIGVDPAFDVLVDADLVDQVKFSSPEEYVFRQPLIRTVAYESQLKADRADLHRRLAAAIRERDPDQVEQDAALIAEHLEAAGDLAGAYGWHMLAGAWARNRDITAARMGWAKARQVAHELPVDDPTRLSKLIAAGTLLCATAYRTAASISDSGFEELRELCNQAGDKRSLAIAMFGQMTDHMAHARVREASALGTEQMALLEAIDDPVLTVGLAFAPLTTIKQQTGEIAEILRSSQLAIDLADGDPVKGDFVFGSPLALALVFRGIARYWLGIRGWREDFDEALGMARRVDEVTFGKCVVYRSGTAVLHGVLVADDEMVADVEEALRIAGQSGDHSAVGMAKYTLGGILLERGDRDRGRMLLAEIREMCGRGQFFKSQLPVLDFLDAREKARDGDVDGAVPPMRAAVDDMFDLGQFTYAATATRVLVETLLSCGRLDEAEAATERLVAAPLAGLVVVEAIVARLYALLARARGDEDGYRRFVDRYRELAESHGYAGHVMMSRQMT